MVEVLRSYVHNCLILTEKRGLHAPAFHPAQFNQPPVKVSTMPLVMLRPSRKASFRRTIKRGRKSVQLLFQPGKSLDLKEAEVKQLEKDLNHALVPARLDSKGKLRPIYEDVIAVDDSPVTSQGNEADEASKLF